LGGLGPRLQLDRVRDAMFWAAGRLDGQHFEPVLDVPVFHPDLTVYRVTGPQDRWDGLWYFGPFAREGNRSGDWMSGYRTQNRLFDAFVEAGDPFDLASAQRYRATTLSAGNAVDPGEAFRRFCGREPRVRRTAERAGPGAPKRRHGALRTYP
jgi:Zn-dependent oligopeptidase